jgi:hypothetical protein
MYYDIENTFSILQMQPSGEGEGPMEATHGLPPEYAGHEGCAALGGFSTISFQRCNTLEGGFLATLFF